MHVAAWYLGTPKFTKFEECVSNGQTPNAPKFVMLGQTMYEKSVTIFYTLVKWHPRAEKSVTVQKNKKQTHIKLSIHPYYRMVG